MFGAGLLNLGSLVLGLIAWILPVVNLIRRDKADRGSLLVCSVISVTTCAVSLCMQIFYSYHLVKIEDWSALMDTAHAVALAAAILLVVTIILNAITLVAYHGGKLKD
jgi:hypothetical protein